MEVKINLNEKVKFKLSERGKEIYRHRYDGYGFEDNREPELDDDGYMEMQLWVFMQTFGEHMIMGMPEVLEPLEIIYEKERNMFDIGADLQRAYDEGFKAGQETERTKPPVMTEEVREALMRLSMCAMEECNICKYVSDCGFEIQVERAEENTAIILNAFDTTPTERTGEWIPYTKEGLPLTELGRKERQKWYGYKCSNCNFIYKGNALTESPFCQNCGAKMKGEE